MITGDGIHGDKTERVRAYPYENIGCVVWCCVQCAVHGVCVLCLLHHSLLYNLDHFRGVSWFRELVYGLRLTIGMMIINENMYWMLFG